MKVPGRVVTAVAFLVLALAVPGVARAHDREVLEARVAWRSAEAAIEAAAGEVAGAQERLAEAQAAVEQARRRRDQARADLKAATESLAQADDALTRALAEARDAGTAASGARAELTHAEEQLARRETQFEALAQATDPRDYDDRRERYEQVRAELADARARHEEAHAAHERRRARLREVAAARDAARDALAEERRVRREASAAIAQRDDDLASAEAAVVEARTRLSEREAEHAAAVVRLRDMGWRGGVPGRSGFVWPTDGPPGSRFGLRRHPISGRVRLHAGVDVPAPTGQPVYAGSGGTVIAAGYNGGYGFMVSIDHGRGRVSRYAHLSWIDVVPGERVEAGKRVGKVGSTGASTGPHLHFEVLLNGEPVDPLRYFVEVLG